MPSLEEFVDLIRSQLEAGELKFSLSLDLWADCQIPIPLSWKCVHFTDDNAGKVPKKKGGVYGFVLQPPPQDPPETRYLLYIGRTKQMRTRYRRYLRDKVRGYKARPHINIMLNAWPDNLWFCYATVEEIDGLPNLENILLNTWIPPFNREFKGELNSAVNLWRTLGPIRARRVPE